MSLSVQTPGLKAGGSQEDIGIQKYQSITAAEMQTQMFAVRFCLSPWVARDLSRLCFGELCNE